MMNLLYLVVMFTFVPRNCVDGFRVIGRVTFIIFNSIFLTNLSTCQGLGYKPSVATYNPKKTWDSKYMRELGLVVYQECFKCPQFVGVRKENRSTECLLISAFPKPLPTLAQKPPMFQSLSDRTVSRNASGKKNT